MPEDDRPPSNAPTDPIASEPTLTPSQAIHLGGRSESDPLQLGLVATSAASEPSASEPSTGRLPERYQLGARLGAGGMGEVLLATDQQIGREVAIKRMLARSGEARFLREAKIQGRLDHPAIVPVHELAHDSDGRPFFVMKRLAGTTLADVLAGHADEPRFSRQKLLRAFADVCLAVEFAHQRGIVHRDLKPANIMLGDFGEVYVLDWGIARILDETDDVEPTGPARPSRPDATAVGAILGTPGYIAPELLRGQPLDARGDVYALGCILFEILTREPLHPRDSGTFGALDARDPRPSQRTPDRDIPPELDVACEQATRLERETRLASARVLAERIEHFLDGDRDTALRRQLATGHVEAARSALAAGDGEAERATAMREAGRAIALDPTSTAAAELVGRLILEPPRTAPRAVEARVEQLEEAAARAKARVLAIVLLTFLGFVPVMVWMGVRKPIDIAMFIAAIVLDAGLTMIVVGSGKPITPAKLYAAACVHALTLVMLAYLFTPFLVAPGIAALSTMMFVIDPRVRWRVMAAIGVVAVIAPWLLELFGVLTRSIGTNAANDLVLHSDAIAIRLPQAELGLAAYAVTLIVIAGLTARHVAASHHAALRSVELQAWHLRQLVARDETAT
jgi:serine/threonine-protein kinase